MKLPPWTTSGEFAQCFPYKQRFSFRLDPESLTGEEAPPSDKSRRGVHACRLSKGLRFGTIFHFALFHFAFTQDVEEQGEEGLADNFIQTYPSMFMFASFLFTFFVHSCEPCLVSPPRLRKNGLKKELLIHARSTSYEKMMRSTNSQ